MPVNIRKTSFSFDDSAGNAICSLTESATDDPQPDGWNEVWFPNVEGYVAASTKTAKVTFVVFLAASSAGVKPQPTVCVVEEPRCIVNKPSSENRAKPGTGNSFQVG